VFGVSFSVANVSAQAPKLLPFQGRLTDQNGIALNNGVRLVQFKIYDAPVGGQAVWNGEVQSSLRMTVLSAPCSAAKQACPAWTLISRSISN